MTLLFVQNISFKIKLHLRGVFDHALHISDLEMIDMSDVEIWKKAKENDLTIVTFDADFRDLSAVWGFPPKIIWIRTSDQRTSSIARLLISKKDQIIDFSEQSDFACLEIIEK